MRSSPPTFFLAPLPFLKSSQDCWRCLVSRSRRWKRSLLFQLFCSFFFLFRVFSSSVSLISSHCAHAPALLQRMRGVARLTRMLKSYPRQCEPAEHPNVWTNTDFLSILQLLCCDALVPLSQGHNHGALGMQAAEAGFLKCLQ